uniref:Uncharacterized protein n=1 Tax=Myoviridae sp. ctpjm1 TaxID=2826699 RepID=A0A8S5NP03_9CAUD|nr:MAG TPA: hypothetical protein [Myoviridae sp. ctpjm1]DAQ10786.1 MAG TPA: hypothetical protein [Caudoviricetes sp.]DAY46005.1 MAG TPA: hypothetical protein [Caudoviricetes sp.]
MNYSKANKQYNSKDTILFSKDYILLILFITKFPQATKNRPFRAVVRLGGADI